MSKVGMAAWSSIGRSTTGIKSVPSPGSPSQMPVASCATVCSPAFSFWAFNLACNCAARAAASLSPLSAALEKSCSGMRLFSSTEFCFSVLSSEVVSSEGLLASCSLCILFLSFMAATLAAAMASSSALLLRPLCLAIGFSMVGSTSLCAVSAEVTAGTSASGAS